MYGGNRQSKEFIKDFYRKEQFGFRMWNKVEVNAYYSMEEVPFHQLEEPIYATDVLGRGESPIPKPV